MRDILTENEKEKKIMHTLNVNVQHPSNHTGQSVQYPAGNFKCNSHNHLIQNNKKNRTGRKKKREKNSDIKKKKKLRQLKVAAIYW